MILKNQRNPAEKYGPAVRAAHYTQRFAVLQIEITVRLDRTRDACPRVAELASLRLRLLLLGQFQVDETLLKVDGEP